MPHHLARRDLLKLAALAGLGTAAGGLLSACSSAPSGAATWSMWSSSAAEGQVWADFSTHVQQTLGVPSVPTLSPSSGYPTKLDLQLVSGTASLVTALNGWLVPTYAARGAHQPLDDLISGDPDFDLDDFYPTIRSIATFDGRTYGIGFDVAPTVLYVNKSMFADRGIPAPSATVPLTWAQFRDLAVEFGTEPDTYGFTCSPTIDDLISWIYCAGGAPFDAEQTKSTLGSPESMEALQFVADLFLKDEVIPPITNLVAAISSSNTISDFVQGNVAFMHGGPWQIVNARKAKFEWDIIPFPAGAAGSTPRVSGSVFSIPSSVEGADLELAWRLMKALTSTDVLKIYGKAGRNNPARESAAASFATPPANIGIVQQILTGKLPGTGGHPYEITSNWNEIRILLQQELPRAFMGQRSISEIVAEVTPRLDVFMHQHQDNLRSAARRTRR